MLDVVRQLPFARRGGTSLVADDVVGGAAGIGHRAELRTRPCAPVFAHRQHAQSRAGLVVVEPVAGDQEVLVLRRPAAGVLVPLDGGELQALFLVRGGAVGHRRRRALERIGGEPHAADLVETPAVDQHLGVAFQVQHQRPRGGQRSLFPELAHAERPGRCARDQDAQADPVLAVGPSVDRERLFPAAVGEAEPPGTGQRLGAFARGDVHAHVAPVDAVAADAGGEARLRLVRVERLPRRALDDLRGGVDGDHVAMISREEVARVDLQGVGGHGATAGRDFGGEAIGAHLPRAVPGTVRRVESAVVDHGVEDGELDRAVADLNAVGVHDQLLAVTLRLDHRDAGRELTVRDGSCAVQDQPLPVEVFVNQTHVCSSYRRQSPGRSRS